MLHGIERLVDLAGTRLAGRTGASGEQITDAIQQADIETLRSTGGHFAGVARQGQTVRLARTIGIPLRYFVAKMFHGPFLITADRIDRLYAWCQEQKIGWQFDPMYTRMVPAHYLVEIDQIGCPDPNPRYHRFFTPEIGRGPADIAALGESYACAALDATRHWLSGVPDGEPVALAFSGGVDSGSVFLLARQAMRNLGRNPDLIRAFTLDLGGGEDAAQAERWVTEMGLSDRWEPVVL